MLGYTLRSFCSIWPKGIETLDTLEITGLPGLQLGLVGNTSAGSFEFLSKLAKDAGLVEILRNTSAMFPRGYHYPAPSYIASTPDPTRFPRT